MEEPSPRQRLAAYALLTDAGRMLLCRIAGVPGADGLWTLPGGGVEVDEHPMTAAVREVREETGLAVELGPLAGIDNLVIEGPPRRQCVRLVFHARVVGGELADEREGTTDRCAWFTAAEVAKLPTVELARIGARLAFAAETSPGAPVASHGA